MGTGCDGLLVHESNHTVGEGDDAKAYGLIHCLSDPWNVGILVFLVVLGSIVSLMNKAGGSAAFGRWASKHVKSKIGVQVATILLGILIFIDEDIALCYDGYAVDAHSVDEAMALPFICGHSLAELCEELDI